MSKKNGMTEMTHFICVDYEEFKPDTYKGVVISETGNSKDEMIRVFSGDLERDEYVAIQMLAELTGGNYNCTYSSSYDDYIGDIKYRDDEDFRNDVDRLLGDDEFVDIVNRMIENCNETDNEIKIEDGREETI